MSEFTYNGAHEICFWSDGSNEPFFSWSDFHLIPIERPYITYSDPNYSLLQIPKSSEMYNHTSYLPGQKTYTTRNGEWNFIIDHEKWTRWTESKRRIQTFFNGKHFYVSLIDDPIHIYSGRISVKNYNSDREYSTVSLEYNLDYNEIETDTREYLKYRIRFLDEYGNILQESLEQYNSIPIYYKANQLKDNYIFQGYKTPIQSVKCNYDYIVKMLRIDEKHSIQFVNLSEDITTEEFIFPLNIDIVHIRET